MPEYPRNPITINDRSWFYSEPLGLTVVSEARRDDGTHITTTVTPIPWRKVRSALAVHTKATARR